MKTLMFIFGLCLVSHGAMAIQGSCPERFEEVPMENMLLQSGSCPANMESYYEINSYCNAHVY